VCAQVSGTDGTKKMANGKSEKLVNGGTGEETKTNKQTNQHTERQKRQSDKQLIEWPMQLLLWF